MKALKERKTLGGGVGPGIVETFRKVGHACSLTT